MSQQQQSPASGTEAAGWGCAGMLLLVLLTVSSGWFFGCSSRESKGVSVSNYNKVSAGMSLDEVEALLGEGKPMAIEDVKPDTLSPNGKPWGPGVKARIWSSGSASGSSGTIVLIFQDDKVIAKMSKGL